MLLNMILSREDKSAVPDGNTILLLHGEDFTDSSIYNNQVTNNAVSIVSTHSKFGNKSLFFNGSAYLTVPGYDFGTKDFTLDWWEYATSEISGTRFTSNFCQNFAAQGGGLLVQCYEAGLKVYASTSTNYNWDLLVQPAGVNILNQWVHRAVVRSNNNLMFFVNGTMEYSYPINGAIGYNSALPMGIGGWAEQLNLGKAYFFEGYMNEFRISNIARWTADFTPPTKQYKV